VVETKHRAGRVLNWLEQNVEVDFPLFISFTGCPNACAQYQIADIGLTGIPVVLRDQKGPDGKPKKIDGYKVLLGAGLGYEPKFNELIVKKVPGDLIHLSLKGLIEGFKTDRVDDDDTFQSWVTRSDPEYLQKLIVEPTEAEDAVMLSA